eukprot:3804425-Amphidinium_carterae.1
MTGQESCWIPLRLTFGEICSASPAGRWLASDLDGFAAAAVVVLAVAIAAGGSLVPGLPVVMVGSKLLGALGVASTWS